MIHIHPNQKKEVTYEKHFDWTCHFVLHGFDRFFFEVSASEPGAGNPLDGTSLYADVVKYASYENHRTASQEDTASAIWIVDELNKAGFKAGTKPWKLNQFYPTACELKVDGKPVESFPAWYPNTTPVTAKFLLYNDKDLSNLKGNIAFAGLQVRSYFQHRRDQAD